jgi:hypothetical protein
MVVGHSQTFNATALGGTTPYSYQWYLDGTQVSGATSFTWVYTPTSNGTHTVYVKITDYVGLQATSNTATVIVNPFSLSISPSSVVMDVGQSQTFTSSVSGGTAPYSYQWYLDGNPVSGATGTSWTYTPTAAGSHKVYLKVIDHAGMQATSSNATVNVNPALSVSITPSSATLDAGQSQTFTSSVSGGTTTYSYQWYLNSVVVSGATSSKWTCTFSSAGSYSVYVKVTDSATPTVNTATSNIATATVNTAPSVSILPTSATLDLGQSKTFTATASGGTGTIRYQWYLNSVVQSGETSSTYKFTPSSSGTYSIYVIVNDSLGVQATSNTASVRAVPFGIDGSAAASSTSGSPFTISLSTTYSDDLLYVSVVSYNSYVSSISGDRLTWTCRQASGSTISWSSSSNTYYLSTWYAVWSSNGSIQITVTMSGYTTSVAATAFAVSGANATSPFDGSYSSATGSGTSASVSKSTSNSYDMVIGAVGVSSGSSSPAKLTVGSGFTFVENATQNSGSYRVGTSDEYQKESAKQSNLAVGYSWSSTYGWGMVADAIEPAS